MTELQKIEFNRLIGMVQVIWTDTIPTEEDLRNYIEGFKSPVTRKKVFPNLTDEIFETVFDELLRILGVRMDMGVLVEDSGHVPWLQNRDLEWNHWKAYQKFLSQDGRSPVVLDNLDRTLDSILDHMGDPQNETAWARRGLVIGQVQSGKTSTYIGLINKAIDAGYQIVVLLAGTTESLRQQTQSRVDQGVVGRDSKASSRTKGSASLDSLIVGVGEYLDSTASMTSLTTMTADFGKQSTQSINIALGDEKVVLFVVKKNTTILKKVHDWFQQQSLPGGKMPYPMLLIDDEADFASINTKADGQDPTATNAIIRKLLSLASRNTYVGFTATPFANIFIDDQDDQDLFPRDFIIGLESPSNYVGPSALFASEGTIEKSTVPLWDADAFFPFGHKKLLQVEGIPDSLLDAIRTFIISNAIRDERGEGKTDRSMLINVSRFIDVQQQVFDSAASTVAAYKHAIQLHTTSYRKGESNAILDLFLATYKKHFVESGSSWEQVLDRLESSSKEVTVVMANSKTEKRLENDGLSKEDPPRQIVVGGDILSRGLTLNGLSVSYFYRRTVASDTLMQMGRWFGYREGYDDLCRIWMTREMAGLYAHVADTLEELHLELVRMKNQQLTPLQYGLAVRNHPDALLITARNKMRLAQTGEKQISLRGRAIESVVLSADSEDQRNNVHALEAFIERMNQEGVSGVSGNSGVSWSNVDKQLVASFIESFKPGASPIGAVFQTGPLSRFISNAVADDLQNWDVIVKSGSSPEPTDIKGLPQDFKQPIRHLGASANTPGVWRVSGRNMRVAGTGDVALSLSQDAKDQARASWLEDLGKAQNMPDKTYLQYLKRPLLLVYPIFAGIGADEAKKLPVPQSPMVAIVVAIPGQAGDDPKSSNVEYSLNTVAQQLWFTEFIGDDETDEEDLDD